MGNSNSKDSERFYKPTEAEKAARVEHIIGLVNSLASLKQINADLIVKSWNVTSRTVENYLTEARRINGERWGKHEPTLNAERINHLLTIAQQAAIKERYGEAVKAHEAISKMLGITSQNITISQTANVGRLLTKEDIADEESLNAFYKTLNEIKQNRNA